jgi:hypothetical protein
MIQSFPQNLPLNMTALGAKPSTQELFLDISDSYHNRMSITVSAVIDVFFCSLHFLCYVFAILFAWTSILENFLKCLAILDCLPYWKPCKPGQD